MDRINEFINDLLSQRGITKADSEDLKIELLDHIMLLKQEYIENGYNEDEATRLALENFGDTNEIGNGIKSSLPSRNKYNDFSRVEIFKTIIFMLLGYFLTCFYIVRFEEMNYKSFLFYIVTSVIPIIIGFSYVNLKLTAKAMRVKNIAISLGLFFLYERIFMLLIYLVGDKLYSGIEFYYADLLNIKYIIAYFTLGMISIIVTKALSGKVISKIRNPYNARLTTNLLWSASVVLMILYYLFPNRWFLLHRFIESIIGDEIIYVSKNILFLTINYKISVPNVGLILFVIMGALLFRQINKKGIESLF